MRFDPRDEDLAVRTVHRAVELGINYFDTAPGYCEGRSEAFIGKAFQQLPLEKRNSIFISTKSYYRSDPTADAVRSRIESQLEILGCDRIHFYNMWCLMDMDHFRAVMAPGGPYEGALRAREEGLIEHICCSTHASGECIAEMVREDVFEGYTLGYNLLNHHFREPGVRAVSRAGRAVVTMNPLAGGMLTRDEDRLSVLKEGEKDSFIAAALRFNLSHPDITVVLSGMKNPQEVEANVRTAGSVKRPDRGAVERYIKKFSDLGESFCTGCGYCLDHCPENIQIHLYAGMWDRVRMRLPDDARRVYQIYLRDEERWLKGRRASDCTQCGECEQVCTQKLPLREFLRSIAAFLDEKPSEDKISI